MALDALGRFAEETFTADLNKTFNVSVVGLPTITHTITADNRYERRDFEVLKHNLSAGSPSFHAIFPCMTFGLGGSKVIHGNIAQKEGEPGDEAVITSLLGFHVLLGSEEVAHIYCNTEERPCTHGCLIIINEKFI